MKPAQIFWFVGALYGIVGGAAASGLRAQNAGMCLTGPRAERFLGAVRRAVQETRGPDLPIVPAEQVRLVQDDSLCVAVARVLGGDVKSGSFASLAYRGPYIVVRAGRRFFIHDSLPEPAYVPDMELGAMRFVEIDTLQPPPRAGHILPEPCWTLECLCRSPWTLRTPVTLRSAPSPAAHRIAQVPVNTNVDSDSGFTIVDSVGLVIVERPVWSEFLNDTLPAGDSLVTLRWGKAEDSDVRGYVAWWRGLIVHVEQLWDAAGTRGARSVREPSWSVWARMTYSKGSERVRGWALMTPDLVTGPNCN